MNIFSIMTIPFSSSGLSPLWSQSTSTMQVEGQGVPRLREVKEITLNRKMATRNSPKNNYLW